MGLHSTRDISCRPVACATIPVGDLLFIGQGWERSELPCLCAEQWKQRRRCCAFLKYSIHSHLVQRTMDGSTTPTALSSTAASARQGSLTAFGNPAL